MSVTTWVGGPTLAKSLRLFTCFAFGLEGKRMIDQGENEEENHRMINMQS